MGGINVFPVSLGSYVDLCSNSHWPTENCEKQNRSFNLYSSNAAPMNLCTVRLSSWLWGVTLAQLRKSSNYQQVGAYREANLVFLKGKLLRKKFFLGFLASMFFVCPWVADDQKKKMLNYIAKNNKTAMYCEFNDYFTSQHEFWFWLVVTVMLHPWGSRYRFFNKRISLCLLLNES